MKNSWQIKWDDNTWTDENVLGAHLVAVADLIGADSWTAVSPWTGIKALAAWCVVLLSTTDGYDLDSALTAVYGAPGAKVVGALSTRD